MLGHFEAGIVFHVQPALFFRRVILQLDGHAFIGAGSCHVDVKGVILRFCFSWNTAMRVAFQTRRFCLLRFDKDSVQKSRLGSCDIADMAINSTAIVETRMTENSEIIQALFRTRAGLCWL